MESREDRQVKSVYARLSKAIRKKYASPTEQQKDEVYSTQIRRDQRMLAAIERVPTEMLVEGTVKHFKGSGLTPNQVAQLQQKILDDYSEWYREEQKIKAQKAEEARKQQEFQTSDFYEINLCAIYGYGVLGLTPSATGIKYAQEVKKMSTETLRDAIRRLRKGGDELKGYPLGTGGYGKEYIEQFTNWLLAEIVSRGEPTEATSTDNEEKSALGKLKQVVDLFRGH